MKITPEFMREYSSGTVRAKAINYFKQQNYAHTIAKTMANNY